ncbi:LysR family transcriptional regulator [Streptomyces spiroverticillatus]|uniref:LysR family transcriptional regulator n=1 Tax=Streptomyces finlayi TaxID=67296 RepID=A0A919CCH7_9ACTN|nr:LysR family transcriptional regulator [Streptomyces finlayi]GHA21106.1 LysR family transcriptional regulator [Streptomyces spiroverticillatus]GHD03608.1 LysR family transcriptional regulator [Streptomyces finlayi]
MDVHTRDLRYFLAVATELSFTRAAESLYVSQPALDKQIRQLERALGAELFVRDRREVRLTQAGEALLPHAQQTCSTWELGTVALAALRTATAGVLTVGMCTGTGTGAGRAGVLPAIGSRFADAHPEATPVLRQSGWDDPTAGLADGSSDVAFVWLPLPEPSRYAHLVLAEEPRHVALPAGHRLAGRSTVDFADLLDEPFLALPDSAGPLRDYWLATDARGGVGVRVGAVVNGPDETYEAVEAGRGVVLVADASMVRRGDVVTVPVRGVTPSRFALAWRRDDIRPLVRAYARAAQHWMRAGSQGAP